jgi:hypothetical protein
VGVGSGAWLALFAEELIDESERILSAVWRETVILDWTPRLRRTADVVRVRNGKKELATIPRELEAILPSSGGNRPTAEAQTIPMMLIDGRAQILQTIS